MAQGFDAPPTLERSGSEHQRAVTSLALLERARAWEWVKDPPAGEGQVGQIQHRRAVTSSLFGQEKGLMRDVAYLFHILPHYLAYYETNHRIHISLA